MIYLYRTDDGALHEVIMTVAEMLRKGRKRIKLPDGRIAKRDIAAEHNGFQDLSEKNFPKSHQDNWAMACHPSQVNEYNQAASERGVPTIHAKDGSPQWTSMQHRRKYLKAFGFHDNAGYD